MGRSVRIRGSSSTSTVAGALGRREPRYWTADPSVPAGGRRAGSYDVFVPAEIAAHEFFFDSDALSAVAGATGALSQLRGAEAELATIAALARNLLRSESSASSRIEGVRISHRRLARASYARAGGRGGDNRAAEVLGNVEAMERAIELGGGSERLGVEQILDIHRTLLRFTEDRGIAGVIRDRQNWIGGNDYHPIGAVYVPPPPELVPALLEDLCAFIAREDLPAVAQAAIVHAQFENIHPFADGNGRTGRALIYTVLNRRGELGELIPPISLVLGAEPKGYAAGLGAYSGGGAARWCARFADAVMRAAGEADRLSARVEEMQADWLERLGNPRRDAASRQIVAALPAQPVIDVAAAQQLTGKSHVAAGGAISRLEEAGVLVALSARRWGRVWECRELLALLDETEKHVSTP